MTDLQFVHLSERAYKYIRQFTIKSASDALVELITNCVDAYRKKNAGVSPVPADSNLIEIEFTYPATLIVRDHAIGLTGDKMESCFLYVGTYNNSEGARGFFSRGAKDISAIGDITFQTIKDDLYSECYLNRDAYGKIVTTDQPVTEQQRTELKMPGNGLQVTIQLLKNFRKFDPSDLAQSISCLAVLREIMHDPANKILFRCYNELDELQFERRLTYDYPPGDLLIDIEYVVPNYPDSTARFVVYKAHGMIPQPSQEAELEFGFLVKDDTTVYEGSCLDTRFRWNPYMPYIYGYLYCNQINKLLLDYDINGASTVNPLPIIDPSRTTGLNKEHPFVQSLLSIPLVRIDSILRELNNSISSKSVNLAEMNDILGELEKLGLDLIDTDEIKMTYVPSYDQELAKAIADDRANFVTSEKSYLLLGDYQTELTTTDQYIRSELIKIQPQEGQNYVYVADQEGNLIPIPQSLDQITRSDPTEIVDLVSSQQASGIRPYIYKLGPNGQLMKLYVFQKGRLESITNPENEYVLTHNKNFQISFINDINIQKRYIIDNSNGVHIKLNINNPLINKYLVQKGIDGYADGQDISVSNITKTTSLVFLRELITEILTDVILENDIINNRLVLDADNLTNTRRVLDWRNNIVHKVEKPVDTVFDRFINQAADVNQEKLSIIAQQMMQETDPVKLEALYNQFTLISQGVLK